MQGDGLLTLYILKQRLHLELIGKSNSIQIHFLSLTHGQTHTHTQVHMKSSITCSVHIVSLRIQD